MAIIDVVVIPVGTEGPSVSKYIAEIQTKLEAFKKQGKIDYQLTPMNTLIEGDLKDLFEVVQAIHELPFDKGLDRVCTNIRIDDRRDKSRKMNDKLKSVQKHLNKVNNMRISNLSLGLVDTNAYFVESDNSVLLVDPAGESDKIFKKLNQINKPLKAILLTHAHFDHIGALDDVLSKYDVPVYMHKEEFSFLTDPEKNGSSKFKQYGMPLTTSKAQPIALDEGNFTIDEFKFNVLHTPGHSPGSLTYVFDDFAVVGDTLFNNGIGRTDLYRGDYETLVDSIKDKLFELDGDLPLFPGHGQYTTVDDEQLNPYLDGQ